MRSCTSRVLAVLLCGAFCPAWAQVTIPQEYDKLIKHRGEVTAFGAEGFGDRVDLNSGSLEILQTDVDLPGNSALPVRVSRRFVPGDKFGGGHFGQWSLDIPYAHGVFGNHVDNPKGWTVAAAVPADVYKRCAQYREPITLTFQDGVFEPDEYWQGNFLHMPGGGDEEMLVANLPTAHVPSDGNTYTVVTKNGSAMRCVALAATSESGSQGDAFEVVAPDGTVYTLNQMVSRTTELISKPIDQVAQRSAQQARGIVVQPQSATSFTLPRVEVFLYPTKVTDRFGNTVTYTWSATNPWQLLQIAASDGRQLSFSYASGSSTQVTSVSDGTRTWTYADVSGTYTVTAPDNSKWVASLSTLFNFKLIPAGDGCSVEPTYSGATTPVTGTITAPTGATATYSLQPVKMGRSWVARECIYDSSGPVYARDPFAYYTFAVVGKTITGPGLPAAGLTWTYAYGPANGCWASGPAGTACTVSSPTTRTMTVTAPDGDVTRHTFGNKYFATEGLALKVEYGWNGTSALRTVDTTYADPTAAPYTNYYGSTPRGRGDTLISGWQLPARKVVTVQQDRTFTWEVASDCSGAPYCFDSFARPTKVVKSSTP